MESAFVLALNGLRAPWLDALAGPLAEYGIYVAPVALLVCFLVQRTREAGVALRGGWLSFLLAIFVSEQVLKPLVRRARPTAVAALRAQLHVLGKVPPASSFSMPSGTATACAAGAAWVWLRFGPRWGAAAALFALVVSLSRVYVGIHWPSDLVAGWVVGAGVALGVARFERWLARERSA